ncbi:MAG: tRNA (adenosine(37)-N6)-threonylcarbamoyltransferase complex ATPase subunit type 1 TsaE [Ignavibacteriales bacterium]|nr:tRNA (adenosine(37)-N6)-threonylcarbamoyltransferase complex ATPase subunit type 1 TsaE [Ignavibacteriales bacterium]
MDFPFHAIIRSEEETILTAQNFAKKIEIGDIILLNGDLGSGKTFFVKYICKEFGVENVLSPSFAIVNEYHNKISFVHFDFYRIKKMEELYDIGFQEYLSGESIVFIEWSNMFPDILPKRNYQIDLKFVNNMSREISIVKHA